MSLNDLNDREREQWYKANEQQLAKYSRNPRLYARAADQMYKNQLFKQKFGQAEFDKTYGMPGGAALRNKQLENRLIQEAVRSTFKPANEVVTDIDTGLPYHINGKLMEIHRKPEEVNISDEEFEKLMKLDP
jgi:hypothetical protein